MSSFIQINSPVHFNPSRKVTVDNQNDYGGNCSDTSGIDLNNSDSVDSKVGDWSVGGKLWPHTTADDDELLTLAEVFAYSNCDWTGLSPSPEVFAWFAAAESRVFSTTDLDDHFAADVTTDAPDADIAGEMVVFSKSRGFYGSVGGSGNLSTGGLSTTINSTDSMVGVLRDAKITISPGFPILGAGRLYTDQNGGSDILHLSDATFPSGLDVGSVITGSNPANPTSNFTVTVTQIFGPTSLQVSTSIDIVYGVDGWTYLSTASSTIVTANTDGMTTGVTIYEPAIDLSTGTFTWSYENPGSLVDMLVVGTDTDLWMKTRGAWTPNWWTAPGTSGGLSGIPFLAPPKLVVLPSFNRLYIIDGSNIHYLQGIEHYVIRYSFQAAFNRGDECQWVVADDRNIYIGIKNKTSGKAGVWVYQPFAASLNHTGDIRFFDMNADYQGCGSGWVWKNTLFVLHPDGSIKQFNGTGFVPVAFTPGFKKNTPFTVYRHGVSVNGKSFFFLTAGVPNVYEAGMWKCDVDTWNFYHVNQAITRSGISGELPQLGELQLSRSGGLWFDGDCFLAGVVAKDGPAEDSTDFPEILSSENRFDSVAQEGGWFSSSKIVFASVKKAIGKLWTKYYFPDGGSVDLRFRSDVYPLGTPGGRDEDSVTWETYVPPSGPSVDGLQFTTTADLTEVRVGDEVTIVHGANAGLTAFVQTLSVDTGMWTVRLDSAIGLNVSSVSFVTWRKWRKMKTLDKNELQSDDSPVPFGQNPCEWVQFKFLLKEAPTLVRDGRFTTNDNTK